jgi:hypothetical protein
MQRVDRPMSLQVAEDRPVALTMPKCPVVHTQYPRRPDVGRNGTAIDSGVTWAASPGTGIGRAAEAAMAPTRKKGYAGRPLT